MFVDACAIVAILSDEPEADRCSDAILASVDAFTSAIAVLEAALALSRPDKFAIPVDVAHDIVLRFLGDRAIALRDLPPALDAARLAAEAAHRFRQGRSGLNLADCFHYACAHHAGVPILATADEFRRTDIETIP